MTWKLGSGWQASSTQIEAWKKELEYSPLQLTVDSYDQQRAHATAVFADACIVSDIQELDATGSGSCSFTITSPHAELLVILPIKLATLLVSIEAAHRESIGESAADELDPRTVVERPLKVVPSGD